MEENLNQNIVPPTEPVAVTPTLPTNQPPFGSWWKVGGLVVSALLVAGGFFFAGYQYSQKQKTTTLYPTPTPKTGACIQVITPARNPQTGECKDFPTPCDVPSGWTPVNSCSTINETINWKTYTNDKYNYNIKYPNDWLAKENNARDTAGNQIQNVTFYSPTKDYALTFGVRNSGDVVNIVGRTGVSAGDFVVGNPVPFDGASIPIKKLVYKGKTKAIFYQPSAGYYIFGNFEIYADFNRITFDDYESRDIENLSEFATANKILSTFRFTQ